MKLTPKGYFYLFALAIGATLSILVITKPEVFYVEGRNDRLVFEMEQRLATVDNVGLSTLLKQRERSLEEVRKLESHKPWLGKATPEIEDRLSFHRSILEGQNQELQSMEAHTQHMLATRRGLSPIFSKTAFDDARNLFWKRQGDHKEISTWMWAWDMMWNTRAESLGELIATAIMKFLWNLTAGVIAAVVDFAIRLPFWIAEYQLFPEVMVDPGLFNEVRTPNSGSTGHESDQDETGQIWSVPQIRDWSELGDLKPPPRSWSTIFQGIAFWTLAMLGAVGGALGLLALIWGPVVLCCIVAVKSGSVQVRGQRFGNQQRPPQNQQTPVRPFEGESHSLHED